MAKKKDIKLLMLLPDNKFHFIEVNGDNRGIFDKYKKKIIYFKTTKNNIDIARKYNNRTDSIKKLEKAKSELILAQKGYFLERGELFYLFKK